MRFFRKLAGLVILMCLVPPLVLAVAVLLARWADCDIDPETQLPCQALGGDYGDILHAMTHFGWYAVETLPVLAVMLVSWIVIEIAHATGRGRPAQPQTPANSRNRERGS